MVMARLGLISVLLTLVWWMPHAEVTSTDGYHLEQAYVEAGVASERQTADEPDALVTKTLTTLTAGRYPQIIVVQPTAPFTYPVFNRHSRAPPQTIC